MNADDNQEQQRDGPVVGHGPFGVAICAALGLNSRLVTSIDIYMAVDEVVKVTVRENMRRSNSKAFCEVLSQYELIRKVTAIGDTSHLWEMPSTENKESPRQ